MAKIWMKNPKTWQKLEKINPAQKLITRHREGQPRLFPDMCISCLNNGLLRHCLDLQNSCLLGILKTSS